MNKKTLTKLEYNKIIELLTEQASSFSGKEQLPEVKTYDIFIRHSVCPGGNRRRIYADRQEGQAFF